LAAAQEHVGDLDRLRKLVKLRVLILTTEEFVEHAAVADGASALFVQLFGSQAGHVRIVYGVHSSPIGTPVMVETVFRLNSLGLNHSSEAVEFAGFDVMARVPDAGFLGRGWLSPPSCR